MEQKTLKPLSVTVDNALKISGLGRTKFYALVRDGTIKTVTVGRRRLVVYASLEDLVNAE